MGDEARLQFLLDCPIFSNIFSNQYFKVMVNVAVSTLNM